MQSVAVANPLEMWKKPEMLVAVLRTLRSCGLDVGMAKRSSPSTIEVGLKAGTSSGTVLIATDSRSDSITVSLVSGNSLRVEKEVDLEQDVVPVVGELGTLFKQVTKKSFLRSLA